MSIEPEANPNPSIEELMLKYHAIHDQQKKNSNVPKPNTRRTTTCDTRKLQPLSPGDLVWLFQRHITTMHPFSKLDVKCLGPFKILEVIRDSKLTF
jgi:hypothetical protein